jgi:hypothetical protein
MNKKQKRIFMPVALIFIMLLQNGVVFAKDNNSTSKYDANVFADNKEAIDALKYKKDAELHEAKIMALCDARRELLFQDPVDIEKLNEIDIQLTALGIEFLTLQEVKEQFPKAKAYRNKAMSGDIKNAVSLDSTVVPNVVPPGSNVNTWMSYRYSNQYYNGQYYNVQKLIAQPISKNSGLWEKGARTVNFSVNWIAGITNLITSLAKTATGSIAPISVTVYDALEATWAGLKPVSDIKPSNVHYEWETQTTAVFAYVRLERQSDDDQWLSHISTKCETEVAYIADIDRWRQNGSGDWVVCPGLKASTRYLYHTPSNYNSTTQAIYAYVNSLGDGAQHDAVSSIIISGPESKTVQTIYPCYPQFPGHCE